MPFYRFRCVTPGCAKNRVVIRKFRTPRELELLTPFCPVCVQDLERTPEGPGCSVVERLDNGQMPRAVERPVDINELVEDHAKKENS